jgi:hypothetical protein
LFKHIHSLAGSLSLSPVALPLPVTEYLSSSSLWLELLQKKAVGAGVKRCSMGYSWGETERGVDKRPNQILGQRVGAQANSLVMEEHKVRPFREDKPTDHVSVAFLARAPHKFTENLRAESVVVQQETLKTMHKWLLSHPKNKVSQVEAEAVPVLTHIISSPDPLVRELAAQVLAMLATVQQGVDAILVAGTVPELLKAMQDSGAATRRHVHVTLQKIGELPPGREAIVAVGGTAMLVAVCKEQVSPDALLSLKTCLKDPQGLSDALDTKAIGVMVAALSNGDENVLQHALKNITFLTNPDAAKKEAIQEGAVAPVCKLLQHTEWTVRAAAAGALASLAVDVEGKKQAMEGGAAEALVAMLRDSKLPVLLLSVSCLCLLAESKRHVLCTPQEGVYRAVFDKALPSLRLLTGSDHTLLAKRARDCETLITWRP